MFFTSAISIGLAMIILESSLSSRLLPAHEYPLLG
ncbi:MAG: hypothetical protein IPJ46_21560 [Anaerolineales bacterium]|nr:hypothetical protein [Anaerolineales bacterium]